MEQKKKNSNYLIHHGVPRMHWGERRWQNTDGSLTPAGYVHYGYGRGTDARSDADDHKYKVGTISPKQLKKQQKLLKKQQKSQAKQQAKQVASTSNVPKPSASSGFEDALRSAREDKEYYSNLGKQRRGVKSGDEFDTIQKGASFQRLADANEKLDSKRKYVSILEDDNDTYLQDVNAIGIKDVQNAMKYTFTANRDLKVAKGQDVANYVIQKYGNEDLSKAYKTYEKYKGIDDVDILDLDEKDQKLAESVRKDWENSRKLANDFFKNSLFKDAAISDDVIDHFKDAGYDAIVDLEDSTGYTEYPLILLDPRTSVSITSSERVF